MGFSGMRALILVIIRILLVVTATLLRGWEMRASSK